MTKDMVELTEIARSWLETPWVHHQDCKKLGCDCIGFLFGVAKEANLKLPEISKPYSRLPKQNDIEKYLEMNFDKVDFIDKDIILLLEFSGIYCHVAIATSKNSMIHADSRKKKVIEHRIDAIWQRKIIGKYKIKNKKGNKYAINTKRNY